MTKNFVSAAALALVSTAVFAQAPKPKPAFGSVPNATEASAIITASDFKVELLYAVPNDDQGSWVCLTVDPKGRLIAGDQYGGLYRITPPPVGSADGTKIERLAVKLVRTDSPPPVSVPPKAKKTKAPSGPPAPPVEVGAHGLLYAFDSLYVMVNENKRNAGLWRLRSTTGDDQFDEIKFLREMKGEGEHGPHALVLGPDGRSIYFTNGNHTKLPTNLERSRPFSWGEDHLLPRMWDARGHAEGILAPGGYIGRTDPDAKTVELFSMGFRNTFDFAFDQNGELFTHDSDMEWDQGTPWYVPTRLNHVVDGGDYGWRSGAGRWPDYYADSLPAVLEVGPGSPTGATFGTGAKFPAKYQHALFSADWTYGTLYALHLTPDGATFRAEKEEFVSGKPLPLTDLVINPHDGAMYFAVGGRRTQSALYRVTYVGPESTAPAALPPPNAAAQLRHSLEALHDEGAGSEAIGIAWPHLGSADRFIRYAARGVIERQPSAHWAERALAEKDPRTAIEALIALARVGDKSLQPRLLEALGRLDFAAQPAGLRLPLLRAWQLAFTRLGKPDSATCARLAATLDPFFPQADALVNRELVALLIYLDSPTVVAKTVPLLSVSEPTGTAPEEVASQALLARNDGYGAVVRDVGQSRPDRQQIAYAYALRNAVAGWTPKLRVEFFSWFSRTHSWKGGASFAGFLQNIRKEALAKVADPAERAARDGMSKPPGAKFSEAAITPKGPGRSYTVKDTVALLPAKLSGRNLVQGKALFTATACIVCHTFAGTGGSVGPDLSAAGSRYSMHDLLENIIEPSLVISDQYGTEQIDQVDGNVAIGRVVGEENGELLVMSNPFAPEERVRVKIADVKSRKPYPVSMMPPGLINALNLDELQDLLGYILSGGNAADPMFVAAKK